MAASKARISFLIILGALMSITSLSTDIYLPALPTMEATLGGDSELTITGFLVGFSLAQLLWGPISDRIGRKIPLIIGIILFIIGSIGCATSTSMTMVVFWRVFQALGACVGPMLSRAMIRDSYGVTEAARTLSTLAMIMAVAPIAGPLLGGALLTTGTWKLIFWVMAGAGVIFFGTIFLLPETLPPASRTQQSLGETFANYWTLLKTKTFMRYVLCVTAFYVAGYAFITGSPKVYITYFGVPEQYYGLLFGCNIIGLTLVSALNRRLVMSYAMDTLLRRSLAVAVISVVVLTIFSITGIGGLWGIVIPMFVMFSTNGIIASCTNAAALNAVLPTMTGAAAALLGSLQYGSGIVSSLLLALFVSDTPYAMTSIITFFVMLSALCMVGRTAHPTQPVRPGVDKH